MVTVASELQFREHAPTLKEETSKENILKDIGEVAKVFKEELKGIPLKQALGNLMVGSLIRLQDEANTVAQKEEATERAREVLAFFEPFFGDGWPAVKSGFLGEVCVALSMKEAGFSFYEITPEDDLHGKIDMLADDGTNTIFAIQIKTSAKIKDIDIHRIEPEKEGLGVFSGYRGIAESMIKYVKETPAFDGLHVVPLIIELPGGMGNEHAAYSQTTGVPIPGTKDKLLDEFFSEVWKDE
jgi:hypothetical protein